jgi:hypothetical protein
MKQKEFTVKVIETLVKEVKVSADNAESALDQARMDYMAEKIVLDSEDFYWVDMEVFLDGKKLISTDIYIN